MCSVGHVLQIWIFEKRFFSSHFLTIVFPAQKFNEQNISNILKSTITIFTLSCKKFEILFYVDMPSEKKSKKNKLEAKATTSNAPLKPLSQYVGDRLELTKQLFSCLKNKQIKQRLPPNLEVILSWIMNWRSLTRETFFQNKSIERIQQICLDEILGISSKRLVSIINNTRCPENTDSDDSEIEQVDEHISLEEISSDSEAEAAQKGKIYSTKLGSSYCSWSMQVNWSSSLKSPILSP